LLGKAYLYTYQYSRKQGQIGFPKSWWKFFQGAPKKVAEKKNADQKKRA
jgi:hypothetical protein